MSTTASTARRRAGTVDAPRRSIGPPPAEPSSRYTPPIPKARFRPRWHRLIGWAGVAVGVLLAVLNDAMLFGGDIRLLPFGHQELYLVLALLIAASSTWFLGVFDREATIYR